MKVSLIGAMFFFMVAVLFGGGAPQPVATESETVHISHQLGEVDVPVNPQRAVVFAYDVLEFLDAYNLPVVGVVKGNLPPSLSGYAADRFTDVGSLFEPLYEVIYGLQPDVIYISDRQVQVYDQLSEIAPVVFTSAINMTDFSAVIEQNLGLIGSIYGLEGTIAHDLQEIKAEIAEIVEASQGISALFLMTSEGQISAYGPGSRFGLVHSAFGFTPAAANLEVSSHGQVVSYEFIAETNPEVIFVLDRDVATGGRGTAASVLDTGLVQNTRAGQTGSIVYLDSTAWYLTIGGPASAKAILDDVSKALRN